MVLAYWATTNDYKRKEWLKRDKNYMYVCVFLRGLETFKSQSEGLPVGADRTEIDMTGLTF